ncbi:TPA: hypothetical protein ACOTG0_003160 [Clostridium perfringens]
MRKRLSVVVFLIFSFTLFVSCSVQNGLLMNGDINSTKTSMNGSYEKFTGKYYKKIKFNKGDLLECTVNSTTNKGELILLLLDKDDNIVADLKDTTNIEISQNGYYYFTAIGINHSGDFEIEWSKK